MLMLCPICAGELDSHADACPDCGCPTIPSTLEQQAAAPDRPRVEFVELCRPSIYPVAMLIKQMLEQNGVSAMVVGGHSLSVMPHLVFGGELRVVVDRERLGFARSLYEAYFENDEGTNLLPDE